MLATILWLTLPAVPNFSFIWFLPSIINNEHPTLSQALRGIYLALQIHQMKSTGRVGCTRGVTAQRCQKITLSEGSTIDFRTAMLEMSFRE